MKSGPEVAIHRWHWRRTQELVEDLEFVVWISIRYADLVRDITSLAVKV